MRVTSISQSVAKRLGDPIYLIAMGISLLFSVWLIYSNEVVTRDGIIYLRCAELLTRGDWVDALAVYEWPFYPALIALTGFITGLSLESAAHVLNAVTSTITVVAFIGIVGELGGNRKVRIVATLVILLFPEFNENREHIYRDDGYWAFYLTSLWLFLGYYRAPRLSRSFGWSGAMALATLFRIEGMAVLFLLPLVLLWKRGVTWPQRLIAFGMAYLGPLIGLLLVLGVWVNYPDALRAYSGRLDEPLAWMNYLGQGLIDYLHGQTDRLSAAILNQYSEEYAMSAIIAVLLMLLALNLSHALGAWYSLLVVHALIFPGHHPQITSDAHPVLHWMLAINVLILMVFLLKYFFLTARYTMPMALTLLLWLPFHIVYLQERWLVATARPLPRRLVSTLAVVAFLALAVNSLVSWGASKLYLKEAGLWLAQEAPAGTRLYTDTWELAYYAQRDGALTLSFAEPELTVQKLSDGAWREFDFLALEINRHQPENEVIIRQTIGVEPIKIFNNDRGGKVLIFRK